MKHTQTCPKCGGTDILKIPGYTGAYGTGNNIPTGASIFNTAPVDRYLCCQCGFSEEWVDLTKIDKIKGKYGPKQ